VHSFLSDEKGTRRPRSALIVDADSRRVQELAAPLRRAGYRVLEARTFADGKQLWLSERPDVLVIDITLGEFNGLQLLMRARDEQPDVRAVITCAFPDPVLEADTRRLGGEFFVRPVDPGRILAVLDASDPAHAPRPPTAQPGPAEGHHWASVPLPNPDRRRLQRRRVVIPGFTPERRASERRRP
jgi:DNA-binding response OmpR family regulator